MSGVSTSRRPTLPTVSFAPDRLGHQSRSIGVALRFSVSGISADPRPENMRVSKSVGRVTRERRGREERVHNASDRDSGERPVTIFSVDLVTVRPTRDGRKIRLCPRANGARRKLCPFPVTRRSAFGARCRVRGNRTPISRSTGNRQTKSLTFSIKKTLRYIRYGQTFQTVVRKTLVERFFCCHYFASSSLSLLL